MFNIIILESVESLMDEIKRYPLNTFLIANEQTKARGKENRPWSSPKSNNLYFAINIETNKYSSIFSFLSSIAILKSIKSNCKKQIKINLKWPNDVLINNKKCSGILLEKHDNILVIGIGINIDYSPENTNFKATNLAKENIIVKKMDIANSFIKNFMNLKKELDIFGFEVIRTEWLKYAYKLNEQIKISINENEFVGIFSDIDEEGALILNMDGEIKHFYSADVFDI